MRQRSQSKLDGHRMTDTSFEKLSHNRSEENAQNEGISDPYPTCVCGHNRFHHLVSAEPTYTAWGHFWVVLMGVSSSPIRLDFRCRRCKEKFDFITNPQELRRFM